MSQKEGEGRGGKSKGGGGGQSETEVSSIPRGNLKGGRSERKKKRQRKGIGKY